MSRLIIAAAVLFGACAAESLDEEPLTSARGRFCKATKNDGSEWFGGGWKVTQSEDGEVYIDCCHPTEGGFHCVSCNSWSTWSCEELTQ